MIMFDQPIFFHKNFYKTFFYRKEGYNINRLQIFMQIYIFVNSIKEIKLKYVINIFTNYTINKYI